MLRHNLRKGQRRKKKVRNAILEHHGLPKLSLQVCLLGARASTLCILSQHTLLWQTGGYGKKGILSPCSALAILALVFSVWQNDRGEHQSHPEPCMCPLTLLT